MTRLCVLCNTYRQPNDEHYFFRFPSNSKERAAWLKAVGKPNLRINTNTSVCSKHFKPEDFWPRYASGVVTLRPNAIPTLMMESENSSDAPGEVPPAKKRKMKAEILKNEKNQSAVEFDVLEVESDEDEEKAVVVTQEKKETSTPKVKSPPKKKSKPLKVTTVKDKNLQFNASIMTSSELEIVKKDKLPPLTIYRLIVPVPPTGDLNTEKIVKQMITGLPQLKALASEPVEPPPLVPMSGGKATTSVQDQPESDPQSSSSSKQSDNQSLTPAGPAILTMDETDDGLLPSGPKDFPELATRTVTQGTTTEEDYFEETAIDRMDPGLSDDPTPVDESTNRDDKSAKNKEISEYKQKIKKLEARLKRMSSRMAIMSEQWKNLMTHEEMRIKQKSLSDNIIILQTQPTKSKGIPSQAAGENINSILMGAVNQDVPPPPESKYMVANYEKLISRVTAIKNALKNKEIVNCIVIQTADLNAD